VVIVMVMVMAVSGGLADPSAASAAVAYPFDSQIVPTSPIGSPTQTLPIATNGIAVNDFNGDTYVADSSAGVVDVFDSSGAELARLDSSTTPAGSFGGVGVSVAANNSTGDVYVVDSSDGVVDVFDSTGKYLCQITGQPSATTTSPSECAVVNGMTSAGAPAQGFSFPGGVAIDQATGDIYVADPSNGVIDIFSPAGAYLRQIDLSQVPRGFGGLAQGVAVDDFNGDVYVSDSGATQVDEFDSSGAWVNTITGDPVNGCACGKGFVSVASDDSTGRVFVTFTAFATTDVFDSSGAYLTHFGHSYLSPRATAVDQASGRVYVGDDANPALIDVFGPAATIPDVTTGAATGVSPTSATLNGAVNSDAIQLTDCHFDYGTDTSYGQTAPCVPAAASIPADSGDHPVSANLTGLQPGTTYHFRLEAANVNGTNIGTDATFSTPPRPSIDGATASNVTAGSADLTAKINPNGLDTTYHFEWGTSTAYGTSVPVPDADIGSGSSDVSVSQHITGLSANTTYHWRVLATNANGTTTSPDHTFIYDTTVAGLPDNRAYEMVTPPQKNGALIGDVLLGLLPDVSENGSGAIFSSIQCFAGAASCPGLRGRTGSAYEFTRTSTGWVTTPLAPPATEFGTDSVWAYSADAGTALFSAPTPPAGEDDFYARKPGGSLVDIGPVTPPSAGGALPDSFSDVTLATADLSHVVYALRAPDLWPFDASTGDSLYEYAGTGNTAPVLVGVSGGAGSTSLISTCGTVAAENGNVGLSGAMSSDGSTVFFTAKPCASGSGANAGTPVPADALYARIDESRTVPISQRSLGDCTTSACESSPAGAASFQGASLDGSKAFFTSTQQLTDNASEDSRSGDTAAASDCGSTSGANGCNLYEYDFSNPAGHNLIDVSAGDTSGNGPRVQGVMAISSDGSHVYFVAKGVLTGTPNSQGQAPRDGADNLYVFERDATHPGGQLAFISTLPGSDFEEWVDVVGQPANVTPDGRFLVFTSHGDLTADDSSTNGGAQVFRYDAQTRQLARVSIGENGFDDNGNAGTGDASIVQAPSFAFRAGPARTDPTMSHDGSRVFFMSPMGLTPHALNDVTVDSSGDLAQNVYEWEQAGAGSCPPSRATGCVYLITDGHDTGATASLICGDFSSVCLVGTDATGANVFFTTADQLVPQDTDTQLDVYDARICTASDPCIQPPSQPPAPCQADACQGNPSSAPAAPTAASVAFTGPGNATPAAALPKVKAKVKMLSRTVHGSTFFVRMKVPAKGRITITSAAIRRASRTVPKPGTYRLRLTLTAKAKLTLKKQRKLKLKLHVAYAPAGGTATAASVSLAVAPAVRHTRSRKARQATQNIGDAR